MARKKSRKKAQFGGLSAAAIKRAQEQAKKVQEAAKKPTSGFTGTRGTFTPTLSSPPAPVQPPVQGGGRNVPPPPQPKPVVPDETGGKRPRPTVTAPQPISIRRPPVSRRPQPAPVADQSPVMGQQRTSQKTNTVGGIGVGGIGTSQNIVSTPEQLAEQQEKLEALQKQIDAEEAAKAAAAAGTRPPPRGDLPDRDPTARQQKEIAEFLGMSLEEIQAMPLTEAKELYRIRQEEIQAEADAATIAAAIAAKEAGSQQFREEYEAAQDDDTDDIQITNYNAGNLPPSDTSLLNVGDTYVFNAQGQTINATWTGSRWDTGVTIAGDATGALSGTGDTASPVQPLDVTTLQNIEPLYQPQQMTVDTINTTKTPTSQKTFADIPGEAWMKPNWFKTRGNVPIKQGLTLTGAAQSTAQATLTPSQMTAIKAGDRLATQAANGTLSAAAVANAIQNQGLTERAIEAKRNQLAEQEALSVAQGFDLSTKAEIDNVTGETYQLAATPDAEKQQRTAITSTAANDPTAAQIIGTVGYQAAQARNFTGDAAKGAAASMVAQVGGIPQDIATTIVEDPAEVEAQIDTQPVEVQAAIAALPTEALVSSQMETLLADLDNGQTPVWAKPALELVEQNLSQRGLNVSSVGRDSMFNAIIQSAMPIAQANAQALQARAAQNLSNQQQANLAQTTADMQIRMANLSNQQTAESQTAQFAQNMATLQSQFSQQATLTSAEREQVARLQDLQNQQQAAVIQSQNQQAINAQELGNEQQVELAELQLLSTTERENVTAENQRRLTEMQVAADFLSKNTGFKQQMEIANLSNEQQMRLANLTARNQADSESLSNAQQTELANLNKTMQVNTTQANIASQMNLAQLNVDQQRAVQNAMTVANLDMAKFNELQQIELANSKFMQTMTLTDFNASQQATMQNATSMAGLDMATLEGNTRLQAQNAQSFLQMDMANLSNDQQASMLTSQQQQQILLSDQAAANAAEQFNATSDNQTNQFMAQLAQQIELSNTQATNQMKQFNSSITEQQNARITGQDIQLALSDQQMAQQVEIFNRQRGDQRYQFNTQNAVQIEQAYLTYLRNASMADTAAQNEANRINVQNSFAMSAAEQAFMYQQLRDEATYLRESYENAQTREAQLYIAAIGNESAASKETNTSTAALTSLIAGLFA